MNDSREQFSRKTIALHWAIALAMIGMVTFGLILEDMPRSEGKSGLIQIHKSIGVVVLALASWRLVWRLRQGMPETVAALTRLQAMLMHATHGFLLLCTLLLPLSGIAYSIASARPIGLFGMPFIPQLLVSKNDILAKVAGSTHAILGKLIIAAIVLHVAAALKHHLVDRDGTLRRMLGSRVEARRTVA